MTGGEFIVHSWRITYDRIFCLSMHFKRSVSMRNLLKKDFMKSNCNRLTLRGSLGILFILALLLTACGGSSSTGRSAGVPVNAPVQPSGSSSSGQGSNSSASYEPQHLIKTPQVHMLGENKRQVSHDLHT